MKIIRQGFDNFYSLIKPIIFFSTKNYPENAHKLFSFSLKSLYHLNLDKIILNNPLDNLIEISNAAGLNKNGEIPPQTLKYLGFDRVVIGTVTNEPCKTNPESKSIRYPSTESLINWMGLPGEGSRIIAQKLKNYKQHNVPLTISLMSTPGKEKDDILYDLKESIITLRDIPQIDRFELNISCPNIKKGYKSQLENMLTVIEDNIHTHQELYLKVSPDMTCYEINKLCSLVKKHSVSGFTTTNTTKDHDPKFISPSPGKGGASGNALYDISFNTQKLFYNIIQKEKLDIKIIACGGINSKKRVEERIANGAESIQIYTPLIFSGPKILRELKNY
jgi:dihydroorotate dehydrogenase